MGAINSDPVNAFFERYVLGREKMVATVKSNGGASVNVDGPFEFNEFKFGNTTDEVVQPNWAKPRGEETNVHVHLPWGAMRKQCYVRLWYNKLSTIPHNLRICLHTSPPPEGKRGDELLWFYDFEEDQTELCNKLPQRFGEFSEAKPIADLL